MGSQATSKALTTSSRLALAPWVCHQKKFRMVDLRSFLLTDHINCNAIVPEEDEEEEDEEGASSGGTVVSLG